MMVAIVGGGIGGTVLASALHRAGIDSTVYEAYSAPTDDPGYFLNLASNGLHALEAAGIEVNGRLDGHRIPRLVFWSGSGRRLGEVANGLELASGKASVCIHRSRLHGVLRHAAEAKGVRFEYGKRLTELHDDGDKVRAEFADGRSATADLLVAADGIHSRVRTLLDPQASRPFYTGLVSVAGFSHHPDLAPTTNTQHLVFGRRGFFGYLTRDSGEVYWFANVSLPETELGGLSIGTDLWRTRLSDVFSDDQSVIGDIIARATGNVDAFPIYDVPTTKVWHHGRVAMIGDALHATSPSAGQGAAMAMEDAVQLARCLRDVSDPEAAFTTFERMRRDRVERLVAYARRRSGNKVASGPIGRMARDLMLPVVLRMSANARSHAWIYAHYIDWEAHLSTGELGRPGRQS